MNAVKRIEETTVRTEMLLARLSVLVSSGFPVD